MANKKFSCSREQPDDWRFTPFSEFPSTVVGQIIWENV